jgi:hypothetical protein
MARHDTTTTHRLVATHEHTLAPIPDEWIRHTGTQQEQQVLQKKWGATHPKPKTMTNKKNTHPTSKKPPHA